MQSLHGLQHRRRMWNMTVTGEQANHVTGSAVHMLVDRQQDQRCSGGLRSACVLAKHMVSEDAVTSAAPGMN